MEKKKLTKSDIPKQVVKLVIKQYKRKLREQKPDLIHLIINIRSNLGNRCNKELLKITGNKSLHREYTIKTNIISQFGLSCFSCYFHRPERGRKTYERNGEFFSIDPYIQDLDLPF